MPKIMRQNSEGGSLMANWESEIREAILRHGQFSTTCLEQDPVKRNRYNLYKDWRKNNHEKVKKPLKNGES